MRAANENGPGSAYGRGMTQSGPSFAGFLDENEINRDIDRLVDLKAEARRLIGQVKEPDQQLVLELRYLCYKPWSEIMVELGCSEPTVYRLHGEALKKIVLPGNLIDSDMQ